MPVWLLRQRTSKALRKKPGCRDGKLGIERHVLRDEADLQLDRVGVTLYLLACDEDLAGIRAQQSRNDRDDRRFASTVRSEQADGLSVISLKTDAGDGNQLSITLGKAFHLEHV